MDVDTLVMTAATRHKVFASDATTVAGPIPGVRISCIEFPSAADADTFATACMGEGVPAMAHGTTTLIVHT